MSVRIEPLTQATFSDFMTCFGRGMGLELPESEEDRLLSILDRAGSYVALEEGRVVGTIGAYRFDMSTPYAQILPAAGTTLVSVLPTHRRRGIFRRLMKAHLEWARGQGIPAVGLWASETSIYGRFGFGVAALRASFEIAAKRCGWPPALEPSSDHRIELLAVDEARPRVQAIYARRWRDRAGALSRSQAWWRARRFFDPPAWREGASAFLYAIVRQRGGTDEGYVQYRRRSRWVGGTPHDEIAVHEMIGHRDARLSLWRFLLHIDLVETVRAFNLPADEGLPWCLPHRRRAHVHLEDALWLAILDFPAVVRARGYTGSDQIRLSVVEPDGSNSTYAVVTGAQPSCERTTREPELTLGASTLASLWWGASSVATLHDAGLIDGPAEARARLARMVVTERAPWCPERF